MSSNDLKEIVRRWIIGTWDEGNVALLDELATPDYVYRAPGEDALDGKAVQEYSASIRSAFPDLNNTIELQIAEGDIVVTQGTTRGTHEGSFAGIAATGEKIALPWVFITRFVNGRIAEEWEYYDALGLMQQLGAIPQSD